jgi:hypothetical protein
MTGAYRHTKATLNISTHMQPQRNDRYQWTEREDTATRELMEIAPARLKDHAQRPTCHHNMEISLHGHQWTTFPQTRNRGYALRVRHYGKARLVSEHWMFQTHHRFWEPGLKRLI